LRGFNIGKYRIIERDFVRISNALSMQLKRSRLYKGDVVYPCVGTIGNAVVIEENDKYHIQQNIAKITPNDNNLSPHYLAYYLMSNLGLNEINRFNATSSQPNVLVGSLRKYRVILPSTKVEQSTIAEILSKWDKAIEKQENLIELKKEQKNGLAFKLLTGKIRISGFKSKWQKRSMSDCFERINEKNHENNNNILTISAQRGLISQEHYFSKQIASESLLRYCLLKKGDYAYNKSYSIGYPFGAIKRLENFEKGIVSPLYICFRIKNKNFSNDYFKQYFDSGFLNEEIQKIAQEGARNHGLLNVSVEEFFQIILRIPEDVKEQKIIAEILTTADKEIELLEKELDMIKEQKKGLMELLLTGIERV